MYIPYNKEYKERARLLRREMTEEERKLWYLFLKNYECRFLRQKTIDNYIVDFYCPKKKIAIEIDGSQHYTTDGLEYDSIRTKILEAYGIKIYRFSNYDINKHFNAVCEYIDAIIKNNIRIVENPQSTSLTAPLLKGPSRTSINSLPPLFKGGGRPKV